MTAAIVALAEAIRTDLNAANLSLAFEAVRAWKPQFELDEITEQVVVCVVPVGEQPEILNRARAVSVVYQIDVGVLKRCDPDDPEEVDGLAALVRQIAEFYRVTHRPTGRPETWTGTQIFLPDDDALRGHSFRGIARLSFRGIC